MGCSQSANDGPKKGTIRQKVPRADVFRSTGYHTSKSKGQSKGNSADGAASSRSSIRDFLQKGSTSQTSTGEAANPLHVVRPAVSRPGSYPSEPVAVRPTESGSGSRAHSAPFEPSFGGSYSQNRGNDHTTTAAIHNTEGTNSTDNSPAANGGGGSSNGKNLPPLTLVCSSNSEMGGVINFGNINYGSSGGEPTALHTLSTGDFGLPLSPTQNSSRTSSRNSRTPRRVLISDEPDIGTPHTSGTGEMAMSQPLIERRTSSSGDM